MVAGLTGWLYLGAASWRGWTASRQACSAIGRAWVAASVCELRIDHGPGYRVYYAQEGKTLILLLCGGDKSNQEKDIETAHAYWKDYKARLPKPPVQSGGSPAKRGGGRGVH